jgi:hypothetical protein
MGKWREKEIPATNQQTGVYIYREGNTHFLFTISYSRQYFQYFAQRVCLKNNKVFGVAEAHVHTYNRESLHFLTNNQLTKYIKAAGHASNIVYTHKHKLHVENLMAIYYEHGGSK